MVFQLDNTSDEYPDAEDGRPTLYERYTLIDFTFKGQPVHWECYPAGGREIEECEEAIRQFAAQYLTGNFVWAGGWFDQGADFCYLPRDVIRALRAILERARREWPTASELIHLFKYGEREIRAWELQWAAIAQHSDLLHTNDITGQGERPLHVAVQEVVYGGLERWVLSTLVGNYGANPLLLDAQGKTAFDYAQGHQDLIDALHRSFVGKFPGGEEFDKDWSLPISVYLPSSL